MEGDHRHVRRERYKGTHPKEFRQKYKELNPDKYSDDVGKIMQQGKTPAGMHRSILVNEIIEFLDLSPGKKGVDATLGYGGHSLEILKRITPGGHLYGIDLDPVELPLTAKRIAAAGFDETVFTPMHTNFSAIEEISEMHGKFDFIIADLGVSSMQIDNPERGFSFKTDGPLDLRLDSSTGHPAHILLKNLRIEQLESILLENSDEPYYHEIATAIKEEIDSGKQIKTTTRLRDIIHNALSFLPSSDRNEINKSCQRCFQALRIAVNNEFESLEIFLDKLPDALKSGGRVAVLTFHSGEDRRVKKAFQYFHREKIFSDISPSPVRPSSEETFSNPRAKSAKLRWAIRST
jgi:16S rRNA (cytosine1402-N4)-methyltransferase